MGYQRRVHGELYFELYSIIMRHLIVLCVASMVGVSTANYYIGHQPMRYYVPQHMYVSQPQVANLNLDYSVAVPGHQQMHMPVRYYVPSAMSGHQHMYVPQPQVVNLDLDYSPSVAFPGTMHTVHNVTTNSVFGSRSGSVNAEELGSVDTNNDGMILKPQETYIDIDVCYSPNKKITLDCGADRKINILSANYGRQKPGSEVCPKPIQSINDTDTNCISGSYKVMSTCNGRSRCELFANTPFFGDPCPYVYKYLSVRMECL